MSAPERLLIALAVLTTGFGIGLLVRARLRSLGSPRGPSRLPPGLLLVTAPFCTRCKSLQARLDQRGVPVRLVDAATSPDVVEALGVRTAPALVILDARGDIVDREIVDFSDRRLDALFARLAQDPA